MSRVLFFLFLIFSQSTASGQLCDSLNAMVEKLYYQWDASTALKMTQQAAEACEKERSKHPAYYTLALSNYAAALQRNGHLKEALNMNLKAHEILFPVKENYPELHAEILNNRGHIYVNIGLYKKALPDFEQSLELKKQLGQSDSIKTAYTLWNLADLYPNIGAPEKGLIYYEKALSIVERQIGKNDRRYVIGLRKLGNFHLEMGNYEISEKYFRAAMQVAKQIEGENSRLYGIMLSHLGVIREKQHRFKEAMKIYREGKKFTEEFFGKDNIEYAKSLELEANALKYLGNHEEAIELYIEEIEIKEKQLGQLWIGKEGSLNNLAVAYGDLKRYEKADSILQKVLAISEILYEKNNQSYKRYTQNYGEVLTRMGNIPKAFEYLKLTNTLLHNSIDRTFAFLNELEVQAFLKKVSRNFEYYKYFAYLFRHQAPESVGMIYDDALALKMLQLQNSQLLAQNIRRSGDTQLVRQFNDWLQIRELIAAQISLPRSRQSYNLDSLRQAAGKIERQLVVNSGDLKEARSVINWENVQQNLASDQAAIEFLHFQGKVMTKSQDIYYFALLLRPGYDHPLLIPLFKEKQLDSLLSQTIYPAQRFVNALYNPKLYRLVWQPLDSLLEGVKTIYYSPSGLLHRIAFSAIPAGDSLLANEYDLQYISSTRNLVFRDSLEQAKVTSSAIIYGGIAYDVDIVKMALAKPGLNRGDAEYDFHKTDLLRQDPTRDIIFTELDMALVELEQLEKLFKSNHLFTMTLDSLEATEESFKAIGEKFPAPHILHLSTHGFFFPDPESKPQQGDSTSEGVRKVIQYSNNPLLRSGLALAGANRAWKEGKLLPGYEDGILTAYEIANMNLSNTELVVLSACKTGLGDIKGSEGVYGLQRAFKMAGVDHLMITLWSIPDSPQTVEFIEIFYEKWLANEIPIRKAFNETQLEMRKKY